MSGTRRIQPITLITPIRRWWAIWLVVTWSLADRGTWIKRPLLKLRFIHVAHWGVLWRAGPLRALPTPYLVFQSNFDGSPTAYIEAFSIMVPGRLRGMLAGAYTFPDSRPVNDFVTWVFDEAAEGPCHYYAAYEDETVPSVRAALALEPEFDKLLPQLKANLPAVWESFVLDNRQHL